MVRMAFSSSSSPFAKVAKQWKAFKELIFCQVLLAVVFVTSGLVVDVIQALLYVTIRPFDPTLFRKINYYVTYTLNSQVVFLVEWWSQSKCQLYIDPKDRDNYLGKEHAILLLNHTYEIDWVMGWLVCDRVGVLGNARVYVKKILAYAPVLGWSWKCQEIVFLERDWEQDKRSLGGQLNNLVNYPDPMWLTLFPEGTRFTPKKHAASMEVARSKGLPELKHHLLPRTRGFTASIPHLREKVPALYDVLVAIDPKCKNEPSMYSIMKGREVRSKIMIRRYLLSEVPEDEKEAADWLHKRYQEKDKLLDNFLRTGEFLTKEQQALPEFRNFSYVELPRRAYSIINFSSWAFVIILPLMWYLYTVFTSGNYLKMGIVIALVVAANTGLMKLCELTRIDKGSSYGQQQQQQSEDEDSSESSIPTKPITNGFSNGKAKVH
ncbi:1-acyl-sn-glycerol-3-phosphate acyltransferase gamma [Orchesella cincta]|uniref:1-acyl-sn-glycerol-3-phosphate acyltransferase gamma n=1 Tax=Orchesella cincta TaxID=48709 RepID=A0A1D2MK59_ORCCI|nr:1-acyl-sn-glycerol-3-phosphate acyltransferase gamma [Orchesella cincta]